MSDIDSEQTLFAEVMLGKEAQAFIGSDIGRYMLGRARQCAQEALDELASVASWRRRRIRDLQDRVWRAKSFEAWIVELIQSGKSAQWALMEKDVEE